MSDQAPHPAATTAIPANGWLEAVRARTPARILAGRAGVSYRTATQLDLRLAHAAAVDAVHAELDLAADLSREFLDRWELFEVATLAATKAEYLLRPDLGRRLSEEARAAIVRRVPAAAELQVAIGDGLSAAAVVAQVPALLPLLERGADRLGRRFGRPFFIRHCRVGILNDLGECLRPVVAILLIGERPGLATAESLSAYLTYCPRAGHTDAQRNLISNIHARGVPTEAAAHRILALAEQMIGCHDSGVAIKEDLAQDRVLPPPHLDRGGARD